MADKTRSDWILECIAKQDLEGLKKIKQELGALK